MPLLDVRDLRTEFRTEEGVVRAVDGVSLAIEPGETLGLVGESGSGKTMTALSILRLVPPLGCIVGGEVWFQGRNLMELSEGAMTRVRGAEIAMVFQDPMTSLNPVYTAGAQVVEAIRAHEAVSVEEARRRVVEMMELVGIPHAAERVDDYPHEFSGGMRQRVMIAMALAVHPALLIADEPTTALDVTIQAQVLALMRRLRDQFSTSILLITHDLGVIAEMADRVMVMYAGQVVEAADVRRLLREPKHPYTQGLLRSLPSPHLATERLLAIEGQPPDLAQPPEGCRFHPRCPHVMSICRQKPPPLLTDDPRQHVRCFLYGGV